jgi:putative membrane protein
MIRILLVAASAVTLTACASASMPMPGRGMSPMAPMAPMATPTRAMDYARMAAASDLFEIQSSQVALQVSQNPETRRFAQMLIDHHTQTTATLMAAARSAGMSPPPPMLDGRKAAMIEQLRRTPAAQFDMAFLMQQVPAHQEALTLHSTYAQRGDNALLRGAAASAVPIVQQHLTMAQQMHGMMMR